MSVISLRNVTKVYNPEGIAVKAVNRVSLTFEAGEFTAIVGASGSGKTTLLNMIGGIDQPTSGEVIVQGQPIHSLSDRQLTAFRRDHIGFIFQQYNLLPVLTAQENVAFVLEIQGRSKAERNQRAQALLTSVGLADKLHDRPGRLSGGQQQRVAVARALAHQPAFVIADEPTANLDSKSTADLLDMMQELNRKEGTTFIFSTHDQRVVDQARRVIVFEDGKVQEDSLNSLNAVR